MYFLNLGEEGLSFWICLFLVRWRLFKLLDPSRWFWRWTRPRQRIRQAINHVHQSNKERWANLETHARTRGVPSWDLHEDGFVLDNRKVKQAFIRHEDLEDACMWNSVTCTGCGVELTFSDRTTHAVWATQRMRRALPFCRFVITALNIISLARWPPFHETNPELPLVSPFSQGNIQEQAVHQRQSVLPSNRPRKVPQYVPRGSEWSPTFPPPVQ